MIEARNVKWSVKYIENLLLLMVSRHLLTKKSEIKKKIIEKFPMIQKRHIWKIY